MSGARGQGKELLEKTPRPRSFSGAERGTGPGAYPFWGPGGPVTNASGVIDDCCGGGFVRWLVESGCTPTFRVGSS